MRHIHLPPLLVVFAACSNACSQITPASSPLLGTWAEIVDAPTPANPIDGRQLIERMSDGRFRMVFVRTIASKPPCTGRWRLEGSTYRMTFESLSCFSEKASKPAIGEELSLQLLSAEPSRLKFAVPTGSPFAHWQARTEGSLE